MLIIQTVNAMPIESVIVEEDVDFDADEFLADFQNLNQLETSVLSNEINSMNEAIHLGFKIDVYAGLEIVKGDFEFDWPAGFLGLLCCPIGFGLYILDKSRSSDEKTSYWIGASGNVIWSTIGLIYLRSSIRFSSPSITFY